MGKTKKRGNGDGTVFYSQSKKKWIGQVTVGRTADGKLKRRTVSGNTKTEVKDKITSLKNCIDNQLYVDPSKMTVSQMIESLIEEDRELNLIGENAYATKKQILKRINKAVFANLPIQNVKEKQIKDYLVSKIEYSNSIISKDYSLLKRCFSEAVRMKIIISNPMDNVRRPRSKRQNNKIRAMTVDEQRKLLNVLKSEKVMYSVQLQLMMMTGMRMGEINALDFGDVNLDFKIINVRRTLTRDKNEKTVIGKTTKTYAGQRKIPLSDVAVALLRDYINSYVPNPQNLLFWSFKSNAPISTNQVNHELGRVLKKYNVIDDSIDGKVTLHSLRHTYATRCIESGMSPKILQTLLGHTDITTTLNTYCDAFGEYKDDNLRKLDEYMKDKKLTS